MTLIPYFVGLAGVLAMVIVHRLGEVTRWKRNEARRLRAKRFGRLIYGHEQANGEECYRSTATPSSPGWIVSAP